MIRRIFILWAAGSCAFGAVGFALVALDFNATGDPLWLHAFAAFLWIGFAAALALIIQGESKDSVKDQSKALTDDS